MIAFPSTLVPAAKKAGIKCPETPDNFDKGKFPHFHCFCILQLARRMEPGEHWHNAKVISEIPVDELREMTIEQFITKGLKYSS